MERKIRKVGVQMVKRFSKYILKAIAVLLAIALILFGILSFFMYRMPTGGELLYSTSSPSNKYTIDVYFHHNSLSYDGVRCVAYAENGLMKRNIYWCFPKENVEIKWLSETEVTIDDVTIDIKKDRYDCRRE